MCGPFYDKCSRCFNSVLSAAEARLAEYEQRGIFRGEAEDSVKVADRFLNWVKKNLP
ncbi:hypothetical protein ES703_32707 [subsurface metagenome]